MASKKKYYAVKKGKIPGVFENWNDCKASVDGFPQAEFKGFGTLAEAKAYLGAESASENTISRLESASSETISRLESASSETISRAGDVDSRRLLVYVDGSYHDGLKKYAFGCVFLVKSGEIRLAFGNGDNPQSLTQRNVTGEMLGAMYAVRTAMLNGYEEIEICYDYEGIEKWVTGAWKCKNDLTQKYTAAMRRWGQHIRIFFTKVAAHSNVAYNELADETAKRGLTEGDGVPKVKKLEELELYGGR